MYIMVGQPRKWMILVATTWIQAFTGTNFNFSSYSSTLKSVLGISQVQLNYLSVASDMGKAFGWCCGVSLMYFPFWVVMFMAALLGLFGYALQWFVIKEIITLPYVLVFLLCLMAGCSICWFNTVCYVLCLKNFPNHKSLALSLTVSFNGVSATLYTLIANAINPTDNTLYLFSNALVPLLVSVVALIPIFCQPLSQHHPTDHNIHCDFTIFLVFNILAIITGLFLLLPSSLSSEASRARILLGVAILLLVLPLFLPRIVYARDFAQRTIRSTFNLVDGSNDHLELSKELIGSKSNIAALTNNSHGVVDQKGRCCFGVVGMVMKKNRLCLLGEEHPARLLVHSCDFWLYYVAYLCGGTIGLVYNNNLGQIAQSLGYDSKLNSFVMLYSICSFFGRLLSAAPDILLNKMYIARTGWLAIALVPTPIAFFLLVASGSDVALHAGTAMIGLSSGFVFSAAVSITPELFGANNVGVNHNILITNIPVGSLIYGLLAATIYDSNAGSTSWVILEGAVVCMGRQCYLKTFRCWGCISLVGLISSLMLFLRTKPAYDRFERNRNRTQFF